MGNLSSILGGSASLASKYAVGEIVDFAGVPSFYDAGDSKWMQGNTWFAASLLSQSLRDALKTSPSLVCLEQTAVMGSSQSANTMFPPAKIGDTTVFSGCSGGGYVLVVKPDGVRAVSTGFSDLVRVEAVGTTFYAFNIYYGGLSKDRIKTSTDGLTWTTISGTFSLPGQLWYGSQYIYGFQGENDTMGIQSCVSNSGSNGGAVMWCGARFLALGSDNSAYLRARLSSDALTWSDADSAVLGGSSLGWGNSYLLFGNGNNCWVGTGTTSKYTTDGGVTWSSSTGSWPSVGGSWYLRKNSTAPSKFIVFYSSSAAEMRVSTNNGASFSTCTHNLISGIGFAAYRGSTIVLASSGQAVFSTNDGASFSSITLPVGAIGSISGLYDDGANFYFFTNGGQLLVTSDCSTWIIRQIGAAISGGGAMVSSGNVRACVGSSLVVYSLDGGVTWNRGAPKQSTSDSVYAMALATSGANTYLVAGSNKGPGSPSFSTAVITPADLTLGGAYFRATTSNLNPIRTGATAMIRVA